MGKTTIEWCDHAINPIRARRRDGSDGPVVGGFGHYCEKISAGCANCYASTLQRRFNMPEFGGVKEPLHLAGRPDQPLGLEVYLDETKLAEVRRRRKPTVYFWADMTDLFGWWVRDEWLDRCFATMAVTPQHTHLVLTKRPDRMREYLTSIKAKPVESQEYQSLWLRGNDLRKWAQQELSLQHQMDLHKTADAGWFEQQAMPNVWFGISAENQSTLDSRWPLLATAPVAHRFISAEPLLGPLALNQVAWRRREPEEAGHGDNDWLVLYGSALTGRVATSYCSGVTEGRAEAVIFGGESGSGSRRCDVKWIRDGIRQCDAAGVVPFVKQLGSSVIGPQAEFPDPVRYWTSSADPWVGGPILQHPKGGDPAGWPADLRRQELPWVIR